MGLALAACKCLFCSGFTGWTQRMVMVPGALRSQWSLMT